MPKRKDRCEICGEKDGRHKRITVTVDRKRVSSWVACAPCRAVLLVLLGDPRNHRRR